MKKFRYVIGAVCFAIAFTNFLIKSILSVDIIAMVNQTAVNEILAAHNITIKSPATLTPRMGPFAWDPDIQELLLGASYIGKCTSAIPTGYFVTKFGSTIILLTAAITLTVTTLIAPLVEMIHYSVFFALIVIQGLADGTINVSEFYLYTHWVPPRERSIFTGFTLAGEFGGAVSSIITGYLSELTWLGGYPLPYYTFGMFALFVSIIAIMTLSDTPRRNKRVTEAEVRFIENAIHESGINHSDHIPWKSIVTSPPVIVNVTAQLAADWTSYLLFVALPLYYREVHGCNRVQSGLLSASAYMILLCGYILGGRLLDFLISKGYDPTNVRKVTITIGLTFGSLLPISTVFVQNNVPLVCVLIGLSVLIKAPTSVAIKSNWVFIAAPYVGPLAGIGAAFGSSSGFISAQIIGALRENFETRTAWLITFCTSPNIALIAIILFLIWGESKEQSWAGATLGKYQLLNGSTS